MNTYATMDIARLVDLNAIAAKFGPGFGQVIYVHHSGNSANSGKYYHPVSGPGLNADVLPTIALALAKCGNDQGDVVCVLPGHAETLGTTTQGLLLDKTGVSIIGCGFDRQRPAITAGAANIVGFLVTGARNAIFGLRLIGSASQTTVSSFLLGLAAADLRVQDCVFEHGGAGPLVAVGLTAAHRLKLYDCEWLGTAAGPDVAIAPVSASNDCRFKNLTFGYNGSTGLDSCAIKAVGNDITLPGAHFDNCVGIHMDIGLIDLNGSGIATTVDSIMTRCYAACGVASTAAAAYDLGSLALADCWWTDAQAAASLWLGAAVRSTSTASANHPTAFPS